MTRIRILAAADLDHVLAIAGLAPDASQWTRTSYERFLSNKYPGACLVAEHDDGILGFLCYRVVSDEAELLNMAVLPSARRRGIASSLLNDAIRQSIRSGARRMFLEVRETNQPAILFYERHGFQISSRRRGYYFDPPADALVLARDLTSE